MSHTNPTGLFSQSQGRRHVFTLPSPQQSSKYLTPAKFHKKRERKKIFLLWLPSSSLPEQSSPFTLLALAHKASHGGGRREINSSQLVLSCNALLSGQAAVAFLARKGGLTPILPSFRWTTSKMIFLPLTFPSGRILAWVNEIYVHIHTHTDK